MKQTNFLLVCVLVFAVATVSASADDNKTIRIIAYNIYVCKGWPDARAAKAKKQIPERLALELALFELDIINFSESPDESAVKDIAQRLGMNHLRFPSGGNWPGSLLTRFQVIDSENAPLVGGKRPADLFTRHWGRATLRLPDGDMLIVHSAHLHPSRSDVRQREITEMLKSMKKDMDAGRSMILMGDLNHVPEPPEYDMWTKAGWVDSFARVGKGNGLTFDVGNPAYRIDYVFAIGPIAGRMTESRPLFEGAFRTNPSDPTSFALSDHLPQLTVFGTAK